MSRHDLSDEMWNRLSPLLPPERSGKQGRPCHDNRRIVNGLLWILRTGAPWRDLPPEFGPWQSVYTRFRRWKARGIMQQILDQLAQNDTDEESLMIEVSAIRAHQHAAGAKGGNKNRRLDAREEVFLRKSTS